MALKHKIGKNSTDTNTDPGYIIPILHMAKLANSLS